MADLTCRDAKKQRHPLRGTYTTLQRGYVMEYIGCGKYRRQHVIIAERVLGKPLPIGAVVHHLNGEKGDNRNCNLVICQDENYHRLLHARTRVLRAGGDPDLDKICSKCKLVKRRTEFDKNRAQSDGLNQACGTCRTRETPDQWRRRQGLKEWRRPQ